MNNSYHKVFIVGAGHSPVGTKSISELLPHELCAQVLKDTLKRSGVRASQVDSVKVGSVVSRSAEPSMTHAFAKRVLMLSAEAGENVSADGDMVDRACSSALVAAQLAARDIAVGHADITIGGGVDMMSRVSQDVIKIGLTDPTTGKLMAELADEAARDLFTKEEQDLYAFGSYERALTNLSKPNPYLVPICLKDGESPVLLFDERVKKREEKIKRLNLSPEQLMKSIKRSPLYSKNCTAVSLANSSQEGDAAAFLVFASENAIEKFNLKPIAEFVSFASVGGSVPQNFILRPKEAILKAISFANLHYPLFSLESIDLFEVNEAFAPSPLYVMKELGVPREKMNMLGGVIAFCHAIGSTGARLVINLIRALEEADEIWGVVSACHAIDGATAAIIKKI